MSSALDRGNFRWGIARSRVANSARSSREDDLRHRSRLRFYVRKAGLLRMEAILLLFILVGLIASHFVAYRLGRAVGERRRDVPENRDGVL
jgi:hypothetical protein